MRSLLSKIFKPSLFLTAVVVLAGLQGCAAIYKTTGDVLVSYGQDKLLPYMLTYRDVRMGCITGDAQTPLLMSFETAGSSPGKLGVMVFTTAAICAQDKSLDAQLRYMRDVRAGHVSEAQDARIVQKRWAALAARRQLKAYNLMTKEFGKFDNGQCPRLRNDFDKLVWLVGNISGLTALVNDSTADGTVGVPRNIVGEVNQHMTCLDNEKWWGAPQAVRAAVWTLLPQLMPKGAQPWKVLQHSSQIGFDKGVRLSSALYAMSAYSKGDNKRLRQAIRDFAANDKNLDPHYAMIDSIARDIIMGLSDQLWTENTGKRTPVGGLGTFWDDQSPDSQSNVNINDLIN